MTVAQRKFNTKAYVLKETCPEDQNCVGCVFEITNTRHTFNDSCIILNADERYTSTSIGCTVGDKEYTYIKSLKKTLTKL